MTEQNKDIENLNKEVTVTTNNSSSTSNVDKILDVNGFSNGYRIRAFPDVLRRYLYQDDKLYHPRKIKH